MRKIVALARGGVQRFRPSVLQFVGAGGVSWGLWDVQPWAGKVVAGLFAVAFGVAAERAS